MHDPIREKFVAKLQNTLLDGKYADRTKFKNLTGPECIARYTSSFISSGNGFGVPSLEARQAHLWPSGTYSLGGIIPPSSGKLQLKYDSYDCMFWMSHRTRKCGYADLYRLPESSAARQMRDTIKPDDFIYCHRVQYSEDLYDGADPDMA